MFLRMDFAEASVSEYLVLLIKVWGFAFINGSSLVIYLWPLFSLIGTLSTIEAAAMHKWELVVHDGYRFCCLALNVHIM